MKNWKYAVMVLIVFVVTLVPAAAFADGDKAPEHTYDDLNQAIEATMDSHETAFYFGHDTETGQRITGKCGDDVTYTVYGRIIWEKYGDSWFYESYERYLAVISGTGPTYDYTWDTKLDKWTGVREIIVEDGVTTIGDNFFNMINDNNVIQKVTLPEGLTRIREQSFYSVENIKSIEIPDSVTSIEKGAFLHCEKLATVKWIKGLKKIGADAFACCGFTTLSIPDHVTSIVNGAFSVCKKRDILPPLRLTP